VDPRAVKLFLGPVDDAWVEAPTGWSGLRTIVFTDIVGSTANVDRLGDVEAMEIVLAHDRLVREQMERCRGREIDHTGDGLMLSFDSVTAALSCAIGVQREVAERGTDDASGFAVRIGLAAGEPVQKDQRLFGAAVNLAARACPAARPGEILATTAVRDLAAGKAFSFVDRGEVALKGFDRPVPLFAVHVRHEAS
ncbi:MAG: adenylate/guanylate cyclase domain-containing protein, partial [Actinomycetota bacterium]